MLHHLSLTSYTFPTELLMRPFCDRWPLHWPVSLYRSFIPYRQSGKESATCNEEVVQQQQHTLAVAFTLPCRLVDDYIPWKTWIGKRDFFCIFTFKCFWFWLDWGWMDGMQFTVSVSMVQRSIDLFRCFLPMRWLLRVFFAQMNWLRILYIFHSRLFYISKKSWGETIHVRLESLYVPKGLFVPKENSFYNTKKSNFADSN